MQTTAPTLLQRVNRRDNPMQRLGEAIIQAKELGFDEINLDLIWGFDGQRPADFAADLQRVLALGATTVTVHRLVRPRSDGADEDPMAELAMQRAFEGLQRQFEPTVRAVTPGLRWLLRPNAWVLATPEFFDGPLFSAWYFSDNERIHIDMLSLGRYAHTNLMGSMMYENVASAEIFDPKAKTYRTFRKSPTVDAALDMITDLVGEGQCALTAVTDRYGAAAVHSLRPILQQLQDDAVLRDSGDVWHMPGRDGVFVDAVAPLLEAAMADLGRPWLNQRRRAQVDELQVGDGEQVLLVRLQAASPDAPAYATVAHLAVSYRLPRQQPGAATPDWLQPLMQDFVRRLQELLKAQPTLTAREAMAALKVVALKVAST